MEVTDLRTVLHAIRTGNLDEVRRIIDRHGLSYAMEWSGGYILLREAVKTKQQKIAKMLVCRGAEVNPRTKRVGYTPLHHAVKNDDYEMVDILLKNGAKVNTKGYTGATPLHAAVHADNLNIVQALIKHDAKFDIKDRPGQTPVQFAINQGQARMVNVLMKNGAQVNPKSTFGMSALHYAIEAGEGQIVKNLVDQGTDVNCTSSSSQRPDYTPLHHACAEGHETIVNFLLSKGANVNARTESKYTALHVATLYKRYNIVKLLLERNDTDIYARDENGLTILHIAIKNGDVIIIEIILGFWSKANDTSNENYLRDILLMTCWNNDALERCREFIASMLTLGYTVHTEDAKDPTFLYATVEKGCLEIFHQLVKFGADLNTTHPLIEGKTLLHTAAENEQLEIAQTLINNGANVNAVTKEYEEPPIFYAVSNADVAMVKLLLSSGADIKLWPDILHCASDRSKEIVEIILEHDPKIDINAKNRSGLTVLHCAINSHDSYGNNNGSQYDSSIKAYLVRLLLYLGADINVQSTRGTTSLYDVVSLMSTPLHCAAQGYDEKIVKILLENGAMLEIRRKDGSTPFHIACSHGNENIITTFLKHGADIDSRNNLDETPLHVAVDNNFSKIVRILLNVFVDVEAQDIYGHSALHVAAKRGKPHIVKELLDYGVDINATCQDGYTPLYHALRSGGFYHIPYENEHDYHSDYYDCQGNRNPHRAVSDSNNENFDDEDSQPARYDHVTLILEQHIVKIRALGFHVTKWNSVMADRKTENEILAEKCKNEIEMMKHVRINDTIVSYYDLLTKDSNQLAMYAGNEIIVKTLESNDYEEIFPIYCHMIRNNFKKAQKRSFLLNSSLKSLNALSGFLLPAYWSLELFSSFSNKQLVSVIKAGLDEDFKEIDRLDRL